MFHTCPIKVKMTFKQSEKKFFLKETCASEGSIFIEDVGGMFPTLCDFFLIMCVAVKTLLPPHSENLEQPDNLLNNLPNRECHQLRNNLFKIHKHNTP